MLFKNFLFILNYIQDNIIYKIKYLINFLFLFIILNQNDFINNLILGMNLYYVLNK